MELVLCAMWTQLARWDTAAGEVVTHLATVVPVAHEGRPELRSFEHAFGADPRIVPPEVLEFAAVLNHADQASFGQGHLMVHGRGPFQRRHSVTQCGAR